MAERDTYLRIRATILGSTEFGGYVKADVGETLLSSTVERDDKSSHSWGRSSSSATPQRDQDRVHTLLGIHLGKSVVGGVRSVSCSRLWVI